MDGWGCCVVGPIGRPVAVASRKGRTGERVGAGTGSARQPAVEEDGQVGDGETVSDSAADGQRGIRGHG